MTPTPGYFDRKPSSSIRPGLSHLQASPSSPHTPTQQRIASSAFNSPSLSYRAEEDPLIFEFGTRHFSAGFTGESCPRRTLGFGPEESRRAGDYRKWLPGYDTRPRKRQRVEKWGDDHELWRMDLRGFDLGIVEDKVERAVRDAYTKYLLLDSKARRLVIIVPSLLPHQLLSTLLSALFNNFFMPSITLFSPPVLNILAAGCRSGLIVDIGWRETTVTGLYEYREISERRTTRAMKAVTLQMAKLLQRYDTRRKSHQKLSSKENEEDATLIVDLEHAEEVTTRMAWCRSMQAKTYPQFDKSDQQSGTPDQIPIAEDNPSQPDASDSLISIPSPSSPHLSIRLPFSALATPTEHALLANTHRPHDLDDHEQPLHLLIYSALLHLPPDVRALCMSRIIITGGGSNIPGLKPRLLDEVTALVEQRGWDPVSGPAAEKARQRLKEISHNRQTAARTNANAKLGAISEDGMPVPASQLPQTIHDFDTKLARERDKDARPIVSGVVRGVETLGAWAGASMLANLRVKGMVEVEREAFLQHGLAGMKREGEVGGMGRGVGGWA